MRVTIFDYGAGNLHSLRKALAIAGVDPCIEPDLERAIDSDVLVLPGVGAFSAAADRMRSARARTRQALEGGLPCLGICLGMQLLFDRSEEGPGVGLGLLSGTVTRLRAEQVPHIGWNRLERASEELCDDAFLSDVYYAHSYVCRPQDERAVVAWTTHEQDCFPAAVRSGNTFGVQFHPEKSGARGVAFIGAFLRRIARRA